MKTKELSFTAWMIFAHILMMLAAGVILIYTFDFPDILRAPMEVTLEHFYRNRAYTIPAYYLFTLTGISFMGVVLLLYKVLQLQGSTPAFLSVFFGVLFGLTSSMGFIRWPFLMEKLGSRLMDNPGTDVQTLQLVYESFHTYAGVSIGENFAFWFEFLWISLFATALREIPHVVPGYMAGSGQALGIGMLLYSLEQFGGWFSLLGPLNMIVHTAELAWLMALAFCLLNYRAVQKGRLSLPQKGISLGFFLLLVFISFI